MRHVHGFESGSRNEKMMIFYFYNENNVSKNNARQFSLYMTCTYLHVISFFPEISETTLSFSHLNNFFQDLNHSESLSFVAFIAYYFRTSLISSDCVEMYSISNFRNFRIL